MSLQLQFSAEIEISVVDIHPNVADLYRRNVRVRLETHAERAERLVSSMTEAA
jgi:hypothetical protein